MSKHFYDIGEIITTDFGVKAINNKKLFNKYEND